MTIEEKAEQFADKHAFRVPYDGSNKFYDDTDYKASKDGYIAGAKENDISTVTSDSDKRLEPVLQKLKDLGVIKSWHFNGTYHAE